MDEVLTLALLTRPLLPSMLVQPWQGSSRAQPRERERGRVGAPQLLLSTRSRGLLQGGGCLPSCAGGK